ncbi:class I SAM-dependent methyltransferase [Micromonospora carbonacea]|uniref:class I SAM-dependent methyltransferase n=1 Tax=Micromonospora carbonacea TaxID=47853 RepID=UPI00331EFE49
MLDDAFGQVTRILADPPSVHPTTAGNPGDPPDGVWRTEQACYEFMAQHCPPGTRTLETGLGVSTALFALWQCDHTCITPSPQEKEHLSAYLESRGIDASSLRIELGLSQFVLPTLNRTPLDLVFIDGCHGFPVPIIDWFYTSQRLRAGGIVVLDNLNAPSVRLGLLDFLQADPRWNLLSRGSWWAAWQRQTSHHLHEDWITQPFLGPLTATWEVTI